MSVSNYISVMTVTKKLQLILNFNSARIKHNKFLSKIVYRLYRLKSLHSIIKRMVFSLLRTSGRQSFPREVQIEATSRCNLSCPTCSHSKEGKSGEHLTLDRLRLILDRLPRNPRQVILSGIGEPLMNPDFFTLVDFLAQRKIRCIFYTNGTLLLSGIRKEILKRTNICNVSISCDGASKDTFEALRRNADFDRWKEYVGQFLSEAKQRIAPINITVFIVVSKLNFGELPDIIRLVAGLGFERAYLLDLIPVDKVSASLRLSDSEIKALHRSDLFRLGRQLNIKVEAWFRQPDSSPWTILRCIEPWQHLFIRVNGDVAPCRALFSSSPESIMGNILQEPFDAIWHGERFNNYRQNCSERTNPRCRVCPYS